VDPYMIRNNVRNGPWGTPSRVPQELLPIALLLARNEKKRLGH
jgi:hypothetical protein